jgi:hypothetical protein
MRKSRYPGHWLGQGLEMRALSAGGRFRQAQVAALALLMAAPLAATPGGEIDTMPLGDYICELPGDATGPAGHRVPDEDFSVVTASSYRAGDVLGSYLLVGEQLTMTSGPHVGKRYKRQSGGFVRKLDAQGKASDLRCVLRKRNNG